MSRMLFLNTTATDIPATRTFFTGLGFEFNETFSDENTACLVINELTVAMLMTPARFQDFITGGITDTSKDREVLIAVSAESREAVDAMADKALATGGSAWMDPQDHGFMYGRSFRDLDGHVWEVTWMDQSAING
ncbi:VOC family protein [Nocardia sp. 348MFTsu5.1]|uniref:VOC family protein n=1 Tax=Nocardia sp. 348MFTsu5.1 TaxID=1172185 RepID=UPI00035C1EDD|nr:VOC family protein [Nocardia sp. 348MFTsu5.1]